MRLSLPLPPPRAPASRMAQPLPQRAASWPVVSITLLLCVSAVLPPIVLTVIGLVLLILPPTRRKLSSSASIRR